MAIITNRPKGTQDVVPSEVYKWQTVERCAADTAECYGFREIRFPTFENTALFKRSVGDTTDVVQKEMYGVTAKSPANGKDPDDFTLRPEGTAGAARAAIRRTRPRTRRSSQWRSPCLTVWDLTMWSCS